MPVDMNININVFIDEGVWQTLTWHSKKKPLAPAWPFGSEVCCNSLAKLGSLGTETVQSILYVSNLTCKLVTLHTSKS